MKQPGIFRIRCDKIDRFGKLALRHDGTLRHLGLGVKNSGKRVFILVDEHEATIITSDGTGQILSSHGLAARMCVQNSVFDQYL